MNCHKISAIIPALAAALAPQSVLLAEIKPNPLFTDGAVLQRGQSIPIWGTARDGEKVTVNQILLDEVWVCSGQSNMEWTLQKAVNANQEIPLANYPTKLAAYSEKNAAFTAAQVAWEETVNKPYAAALEAWKEETAKAKLANQAPLEKPKTTSQKPSRSEKPDSIICGHIHTP